MQIVRSKLAAHQQAGFRVSRPGAGVAMLAAFALVLNCCCTGPLSASTKEAVATAAAHQHCAGHPPAASQKESAPDHKPERDCEHCRSPLVLDATGHSNLNMQPAGENFRSSPLDFRARDLFVVMQDHRARGRPPTRSLRVHRTSSVALFVLHDSFLI